MGFLSDVARRRIAAVLLVVGIAVAALAIADVGPFSNPPTESERVEATVQRFFDSAHDKDFAAVCDQLTKQKQQDLQQRAGSIVNVQKLKGCDEILGALLGDRLAQTRISKVVDVRVSGNQAVEDANLRTSGSNTPLAVTFELFLIGEDWKINNFTQ